MPRAPSLLLLAPLVGLFTLGPTAAAEPGPIVAVFDIDDRTRALEESAVKDLADYLAVLLTQGGWQVVPRDQLRARLKEAQTDSYKACVDQSCQVELGRELAAQKTLSTQIFKLGGQCRVTATLYDLRRAATEKAETVKAECDPEKLGLALEEIARAITGLSRSAAEQARKDKELADRRAEEDEARRKATEAAVAQATAEAEAEAAARSRADQEAAARSRADQEAAAKARADQEAVAKAKAEEEAARVRGQEEESAGGIGDHLGVVGAHLGILSPGLGSEAGVFMEWEGYSGEAETELGAYLDLGLDFLIGRYFSIGLAINYLHAETEQTFQSGGFLHADTFDYLAFSLRLKGRLPIAEVVELRLGLNVGAGLWIHVPKIEVASNQDRFSFDTRSGFAGLAAGGLLEVAWWVLPELGLVFGFGVLAQPFGWIEGPAPPNSSSPDPRVDYDLGFPPRLTLTLGAEYGF